MSIQSCCPYCANNNYGVEAKGGLRCEDCGRAFDPEEMEGWQRFLEDLIYEYSLLGDSGMNTYNRLPNWNFDQHAKRTKPRLSVFLTCFFLTEAAKIV